MTTVAIGAAMVPQVSKNVIISLARRMGLPKRASPIRRGSVPKPPRLYPPRVNQWTPRMKTLEPIVVDIASLFGVEAVRKPVQKRELPPPPPVPVSPHRTCQWPIGEPRKPGFRFCGEATALGYSYCPHHCRQAYVNWQGRPMAMAA